MSNETSAFSFVEVQKVTDLALLCLVEGEDHWIPKSQLDDESEITEDSEEGECGELVIPSWLAIDKGLE